MTKSPSLWGKKGIQATGIDQGALGDCYFLAALSALAEHPQRIKALFGSEFTRSGIMQINFYEKGEKKTFVIDDKLPVDKWNRLPFAKISVNGAWWVPLLEKAYAKFNVNYI